MKNFLSKYTKFNYFVQAIVILLIITVVSHLFREHLDIINIALMHIIPVIYVAIRGKIKATFFITLISVICINFLYIPPLYSFNVHEELYLITFIIFGIVGGIITYQAKKLDSQKKQNQLRESLLNIISHDLRTPLATIHGTTNLILSNDDIDQVKQRDLLEDINYASLRMKRLITNLLDSTRLSGQIKLKYEWCDFEDIVGVSIENFSQKQNEDYLNIELDELGLYWGDNTLLTQLITNLLDNAFKYSKSGSKIDLQIENFNEYIKITVFNKSEFINKKKLKNIFDKFYRLEDTNDISGSGIGLAICKNIVKLHGGDIKASHKNNGILIEVDLPVKKKAKL
ncbi:DUF4118 domain-containing protein [Arcobacter sp. CECT 8985]|uniref:sensor histidine kinase n=1 Tax=Arcobacter sp. CECT 8985 TaxID=1935424 RepID=UPI00100A4EA2|nr:DUF4118 domain-containing protein [Arcobacter sp. CECT 8985]RXJ88220.1 sensor histidine kinase [Arcobacter sp. CECT 8985]